MTQTMVEKEIESIRHRLLSDLPNEMAVRMGVVDPLLRALGWDTSDYKKVYPEFSTPNGRVDYALCSESSEPLCFIEAKPIGKIDNDTKKQLFGYNAYFRVSVAVLTDGQEWHFFYFPGEDTWEDWQVHTLDLINSEIQENATFFQRHLSYQAVRSGSAVSAMKSDYENSVIEKKMKAHCPDADTLMHLLSAEDDQLGDVSIREFLAKSFENAIGQRPTDQQVDRFLKSVLFPENQPSPDPVPRKNQSQKRERNERLHVTMHDGTVISEDDFKDQNGVVFEVMKRLVDEFGGDKVIAADKKGSRNGFPFFINDVEIIRPRKKSPIKVEEYCGYYIAQGYDIDQKKDYLKRLADNLGIDLDVDRLKNKVDPRGKIR